MTNIEESHNDNMRLVLLKQIDLIGKFETEVGVAFDLRVKQAYD